MRDVDIRDNTRRLNRLLREKGLLWVVEEVSRVIAHGVEEKKAVSFEMFDIEGEPIPRRGPKSEVTATRAYTQEEQLVLLLNAVRTVLVDAAEIRAQIFRKLGEDVPGASVQFEPDVPTDIQERGFVPIPEDQGKPFVLTRDSVDAAELSRPLARAITATMEDLDARK
jgi:hypothetical protein